MTRVLVLYRLDFDLARQRARESGQLPPTGESGMIDAGSEATVCWGSAAKKLCIYGAEVDQTIEAVEYFSIGIEQ